MDRKRRIALYGGTFDPIHLGHLEVARRVFQLFEIDQLWFVLAQMAPHKQSREVTPALHRYAMLALATADEPRFLISTFELDAPIPSYTVDTLEHFKGQWSESTDIYFIMGADSWSEITTWRDSNRLLAMTNHIVVSRPGYQIGLTHVGAVADRIVDLRGTGGSQAVAIVEREKGQRIFLTDVVMMDVSATDIRRAVKENSQELCDLVAPPVAEYIGKYQLYRDTE